MPSEYWSHYEGGMVYISTLVGNVAGKSFTLDFTWQPVEPGTNEFYIGTTHADAVNVALRDNLSQALQPILKDNVKQTRWFTFDILNETNWDELNFVTSGTWVIGDVCAIWNCYHYQYTPDAYGVHKGSKAIPGVPEEFVANQTITGSEGDPGSPLGKVKAVENNLLRIEGVDSGDYDLLACVMRRKKFPILQPDGSTKMLYRPWKVAPAISCTFSKYGHNTGRE